MSLLGGVPAELLVLPPLALAAGVDLYLTLLVLGAAPGSGWWETMPGALGDLAAPGVVLIVGSFYLLEFLAEAWPSAALFWNAFHAIIRPLAGALLALLLLDGHSASVVVPGAVAAGLIASGAHATRTGGGILLWLDSARHPSRVLVALLEDVSVVGMVVLALDAPRASLAVALLVLLVALPVAGSQIRAFAFAVRLVWARVWLSLRQSRWDDPEIFPGWVRQAVAGDPMAPGGGLRGSTAGGHRIPGAPRFVVGWIVVRGDTPLFVYPRRRTAATVDLGPLRAARVTESPFFRRVEMLGPPPANLYLGLDGPGAESLRAEFLGAGLQTTESWNPGADNG